MEFSIQVDFKVSGTCLKKPVLFEVRSAGLGAGARRFGLAGAAIPNRIHYTHNVGT